MDTDALNAQAIEVSSSSSSSESEDECRPAAAMPSSRELPTESAAAPLPRHSAANNIVAARLEEVPSARLSVCQGKACVKRGARELLEAARQAAEVHSGDIAVTSCKCLDQCKKGPNVSVRAPGGGRAVTLNGVHSEMLLSIMRRTSADVASVAC